MFKDMSRKFDLQFFGGDGAADPDGGADKGADSGTEKPPKGDPKPDDKIFSQAYVDKIIKDRLEKERKKYADYEDLKAKAAQLSEIEAKKLKDAGEFEELLKQERAAHAAELEKQKAVLEALEAEKKDKETEALRLKIAAEKGIRLELADRLRGDTEEEIRADAEAMSAFFAPANPDPSQQQPKDKAVGSPANPPASKPGAKKTWREEYEAGQAEARAKNEADRQKMKLLDRY
ncbi:MAG: DUF4355 domain-containing protein [Peptococcaceae bacterium]|jgi:hypothetical protein|nr:DUF4355 domain-containing protein [Peptococcaceae bacterium]